MDAERENKTDLLGDWCRDVIEGDTGMNVWEEREGVVFHVPERVAVALFVVRSLGNNPSPETQAVVDLIVERRRTVGRGAQPGARHPASAAGDRRRRVNDWREMPKTDRDAIWFLEGAVRDYAREWIAMCDKADRDRPTGMKQTAIERKYVKRHRARANVILRWLHKLARENGGDLPMEKGQ